MSEAVAPGAGPRHLAFSHDGKTLYVIDEPKDGLAAPLARLGQAFMARDS